MRRQGAPFNEKLKRFGPGFSEWLMSKKYRSNDDRQRGELVDLFSVFTIVLPFFGVIVRDLRERITSFAGRIEIALW